MAGAILHEIVHQWIGNLVSIDNWEDLWLKEGLATWFSWYGIDHFFPNWKTWDTYVVYTLQTALFLDARTTSHPVKFAEQSYADIKQDFDDTTYQKGCAMVTML